MRIAEDTKARNFRTLQCMNERIGVGFGRRNRSQRQGDEQRRLGYEGRFLVVAKKIFSRD